MINNRIFLIINLRDLTYLKDLKDPKYLRPDLNLLNLDLKFLRPDLKLLNNNKIVIGNKRFIFNLIMILIILHFLEFSNYCTLLDKNYYLEELEDSLVSKDNSE